MHHGNERSADSYCVITCHVSPLLYPLVSTSHQYLSGVVLDACSRCRLLPLVCVYACVCVCACISMSVLPHQLGTTALHLASDLGLYNMVRMLIAAGADVNMKSVVRATPVI